MWGLVEYHCGGYFHAATSLLNRVDQVQSNFFVKLGISEQQTCLDFNLAPNVLRRDVAILGLLHKRVLGQSHHTFEKFLPFYSERSTQAVGLDIRSSCMDNGLKPLTTRSSLANQFF